MYQELIINISSFFMLERMMKMENQEINYEEKIELLDEVLNSSIEFDVKKHCFLWIRQFRQWIVTIIQQLKQKPL